MTLSACYIDGTTAKWQEAALSRKLCSCYHHKRITRQKRDNHDPLARTCRSCPYQKGFRTGNLFPEFIWGTYVKTLACIQSLVPVNNHPSLCIWDQASLPPIPKCAGCSSGYRKGGCLYQSFFHGGKRRAGHHSTPPHWSPSTCPIFLTSSLQKTGYHHRQAQQLRFLPAIPLTPTKPAPPEPTGC